MRKIKNLKTKLDIFGIFIIISVTNSTLVNSQNLSNNTLKCEWFRTWGGSGDDDGHGLVLDSFGNVYIAGYTSSFGAGAWDFVLVKYDEDGLQKWNRQWGGTKDDICLGVAIDSFRNVYLAGSTKSFGAGNYDMALVKYDEDGVQQWNRTWGGPDHNIARDVILDSSSRVYLVGHGQNMVLVKYTGNGVQLWNRSWGGGYEEICRGAAVDLSDNLYIAGYSNSYGAGSWDMVLVKYNEIGVQQWNRTWGGVNDEVCLGVAVDSLDNAYLVGTTNSFGAGNDDIVLVKYNTNGVQQWNRTWGGIGWDYGYGVTVNSSGNVFLTGSFEYNIVLVEYDGNGVHKGNWTWGGGGYDEGREVLVDLQDNIYIVGTTNSYGEGEDDIVLVKLVPDIPDTGGATSVLSIPSYNIYIIIGILSINSLFLVKKKKNEKS